MPRSTTKPQRPEPTFWVDECLGGGEFESTLRVGGLRVVVNKFPKGTIDTDWLQGVASRDWVAITSDRLKADLAEQVALVAHARCFVMIGAGAHRDLANLFLRKIKWVRRVIESEEGAFLGKIYIAGERTEVVSFADLLPKSRRRWGR